MKFNFGGQENSWVGYSELEVIGMDIVELPPEFDGFEDKTDDGAGDGIGQKPDASPD